MFSIGKIEIYFASNYFLPQKLKYPLKNFGDGQKMSNLSRNGSRCVNEILRKAKDRDLHLTKFLQILLVKHSNIKILNEQKWSYIYPKNHPLPTSSRSRSKLRGWWYASLYKPPIHIFYDWHRGFLVSLAFICNY